MSKERVGLGLTPLGESLVKSQRVDAWIQIKAIMREHVTVRPGVSEDFAILKAVIDCFAAGHGTATGAE